MKTLGVVLALTYVGGLQLIMRGEISTAADTSNWLDQGPIIGASNVWSKFDKEARPKSFYKLELAEKRF